MGTKSNAAAALLAITLCPGLAWPDIKLTLVDGKGAPIPGVSCSQAGGVPGISDASGRLTISNVTSVFTPRRGPGNEILLSHIPLAAGERARVSVTDVRGRNMLRRGLAAGERLEFSPGRQGVYVVEIASPRQTVRGRAVDFGQGLVFQGIHSQGGPDGQDGGARALRKASRDVPVISCSKAGFPTQSYPVADGSTLTIDFSKLHLVPLFDASTALEPAVHVDTDTAFLTYWNDRARDRHAKEDQFHIYDHYLGIYWEHRTAAIKFIDYVPKGGKRIDIEMETQWELAPNTMEFRAFYRGIGTVAEYIYQPNMKQVPGQRLKYTNSIDGFYSLGPNLRDAVKRELRVGDKIEIEISQFLAEVDSRGIKLEGRARYYGTTVLYIVGKGLVPFETRGKFGDLTTEREDSFPLPEHTWAGGRTTLPYQYSNEPKFRFMQMAQNIHANNGQRFMKGRRVLHTDFLDGSHDEPGNPDWPENAGKGGPHYINTSCASCHTRNGKSLPPPVGDPMYTSVVRVGDAAGNPHPKMGSVLQPQTKGGSLEGYVKIIAWTEAGGLRKPVYGFDGGPVPTHFSVRTSPQLVGLGLLEAIPESFLQGMADPDDADGDGISGRINIVTDPETHLPRLGRFGWKAGKASLRHQIAGAFNTDMGVMTRVLPKPDCGAEQTDCGPSGQELADSSLNHMVDYIGLLGVPARRDYQDAQALRGEALFGEAGCAACHTPQIKTSPYHPKAELRDQTIRPYTDLLLHDMGLGLADNLGEGLASGAEWRTPPLWSLGLADSVSGGTAFLHDGRARDLKEAILWHGGEGEKSMKAFKAMAPADQEAMIRFLKSL